jgi:hypothetical protein
MTQQKAVRLFEDSFDGDSDAKQRALDSLKLLARRTIPSRLIYVGYGPWAGNSLADTTWDRLRASRCARRYQDFVASELKYNGLVRLSLDNVALVFISERALRGDATAGEYLHSVVMEYARPLVHKLGDCNFLGFDDIDVARTAFQSLIQNFRSRGLERFDIPFSNLEGFIRKSVYRTVKRLHQNTSTRFSPNEGDNGAQGMLVRSGLVGPQSSAELAFETRLIRRDLRRAVRDLWRANRKSGGRTSRQWLAFKAWLIVDAFDRYDLPYAAVSRYRDILADVTLTQSEKLALVLARLSGGRYRMGESTARSLAWRSRRHLQDLLQQRGYDTRY